jgi:hypothetical protein
MLNDPPFHSPFQLILSALLFPRIASFPLHFPHIFDAYFAYSVIVSPYYPQFLRLFFDCTVPSCTLSLMPKEPEPEFVNLLRSPGIDSKESIPPAYVAWRAGTTTLFLHGS